MLTIKCSDTPSISHNKFESLNKVDLIDAGESDFYSEEIENYLNDDLIPIGVENSVFDPEGDILFLKRLLKSKVHLNPLFDDDEINSDELESHVESNFVESLSTHDALIDSSQKFDNLEEFSRPLIPIHIAEEEKIMREHVEYISHMEMLFTINLRPHPTVNANTIFESIPSSIVPIQDNDSQREEIDIVTNTDVLPPGFENDDSDGEIDVVEELHVDNSISNLGNELSDNEESDFDNPLIPRPPPEPPDAEPLIPIHIAEEEKIMREHVEYISHMEMLFTINLRPHPTVNANTIFESIPSSIVPIQDNDSQREEIDIVTNTDVLPPEPPDAEYDFELDAGDEILVVIKGFENDDSDGEIDVVEELHVDNSISNLGNELSDNEESDFDNPLIPRPPPEPPDAEYDFELDAGDEILVVIK
nr:hypothetical protein [Tanacetum cinerariifolium]